VVEPHEPNASAFAVRTREEIRTREKRKNKTTEADTINLVRFLTEATADITFDG
jgi:predicted polyphosphate/ATP-dependent NAD kinase